MFIPYREYPSSVNGRLMSALPQLILRAHDAAMEKYYFWGELECRKQSHIETELVKIIKAIEPDLIVVSHMGAAVQAPSIFDLSIPCCLICLNNEVRLYGELKSRGGVASMGRVGLWFFRHFNWIANFRARRFMTDIYRKCSGVATLTPSDMPLNLPGRTATAVIPPILERDPRLWQYAATRRLLFVGNIFYGSAIHFPNWSSIEWLCTHLAPQIARLDATIVIEIIGAEKSQVPEAWHSSNVKLMGRSGRDTLIHRLTTTDLFIAPIANEHGSKLKLAECVSHGTPFAATDGAMSGLPFLPWIPRIYLHEPEDTARTVLDHLNSPEKLAKMSESILAAAEAAREAQDAAWSDFFVRSAEGTAANPSVEGALGHA
jgi:hypothetical protein